MNKRYYSYNRIHPLAHQYSLGDWLSKQAGGKSADELWGMTKSGIGDALKGNAANIALGIGSKIINPNGNTTAFSDFGNTVGNLVGMIPGVGTVAGLGIKGITALTDAAFGSNVNEAAVRGLRADLNAAQNNIGSALTWDTLADSVEELGDINVAGADLGSQGWFNHDVDKARNRLKRQQQMAQAAIDYAADNINTLENRQMMGTALADGGKIHIKPSKKGTFTAQATKMGMGVQEAARHILANKERYSPAMVKKANFARNASKWHAEGGPIFKTDYDMGLTFINEGGTHEQNPYGGVFMGMAPDGQPNQVEEGEIIFNDYVYSNRLKVPKAVRNKYKLREKKDLSFADAIEEYIKKNGIEERNNDPIANRGLEAFASELAMEQEMVKAKKEMKESRQAAFGGHLFDRGGPYILYDRNYRDFDTLYNEESPYMRALNWFNQPENSAQRDALIADINSGKYNNTTDNINGFTVTPDNWYGLATDYKKGPVHNALIAWANQTHADAEANRALGTLPEISDSNILNNGVVSTRALNKFGKLDNTSATWNYAADKGGLYYNTEPELPGSSIEERAKKSQKPAVEEETGYDPAYWLAGLGANVSGLMANILDPYRPQVLNEIRAPRMVNPKYIGDYTEYTPYDINYATSQQDANSAATMNALMQSIAPIRNASLLANDFNANATRGATRRQALEYNDSLRKAVADFNRNTNEFNAQMYVDAAARNQAAKQAYFENRMRQAQFNAQMDFQHKMAKDQAIGQGITSIADYLNNVGKEDVARAGVDVYQSTMPTGNAATQEYTRLAGRRNSKSRRRR